MINIVVTSKPCDGLFYYSYEYMSILKSIGMTVKLIVISHRKFKEQDYVDSITEKYIHCDDIIFNESLSEVSKLIKIPNEGPLWKDKQRWRYAHPKVALDIEEVEECSPDGWFFCGDSFVGRGRVGEAILTGFDAANRILK